MTLEAKIETILFFKGEPLSRKRLADILSSSAKVSEGQGKLSAVEINQAIEKLKENLAGRGIVLQEIGEEITLGTAPEMGKIIEDLQKEELNKDLSRASLETLAVVLYKGGATRGEIDYIRGVNSSFILRALSVRGLVKKTVAPKDARRFLYKPSFDLLSFMGVKNVAELPEYREIEKELTGAADNLEKEAKKEE